MSSTVVFGYLTLDISRHYQLCIHEIM